MIVEHRSLDFNLDAERFNVTFVARGRSKVKQLFSLTQDVVDNDIMFLDIGTNNISVVDPLHWETASSLMQATRLSWPQFGA